MTMKNEKTLHRFAAVAAVLLAFCLVFMMPVGATEVTCTGCSEQSVDGHTHVAQIVNGQDVKYYETLQGAVDSVSDSAQSPTTIKLLGTSGKEITGDGVKVNKKNIIIDFSGFTYNITGALVGSTESETQCFQILKDSSVTMQNGKITVSSTAYKPNYNGEDKNQKAAILIHNYGSLTLENIELDGSTLTHTTTRQTLSNKYGTAVIKSNTVITAADDWVACGSYDYNSGGYNPGPSVTVEDGATITGKIEVSSTNDCKLTVNGGTFTDPTVLNYLGENADVTVTLKDDVAVSETITVSKGKATLDLNGQNIQKCDEETVNPLFKVTDDASLTIKESTTGGSITSDLTAITVDNGQLTVDSGTTITGATSTTTTTSAIKVIGSSSDVASYSTVMINSGAKVISTTGYSVGIYQATDQTVGYGAELTVSGDLEASVTVLGNIKPTTGNVPKITITESAKITSDSNSAIYAAGYGIWEIAKGAELTGNEALSIKSGKFTINGGTFTATGTNTVPPTGNDNGPENTGAALSITSNDDYAGEIEVTVTGGTFISQKGHAVYEGIAKKESETGSEATGSKVNSISINAGSFASANGDDVIRIDEATNKKVVSGGVFNTPVNAKYIAEGKVSVYNNGDNYETYPYAVVDADDVRISINKYPIEFSIYSDVTDSHEITINNLGNLPVTVTGIMISPATEKLTNTTVVSPDLPVKGSTTFILSWDKLPAGEYTVTISAKAVDGEQTTSTTIPVKVTERETVTPPPEDGNEGNEEENVPTQPTDRPTSGGATDTGSGNYNEYPRQADGKAGEISFGSSKDVKAVDLPEGVTGEVKLIAKSTHPAPEGKDTHKVFEINIPNYPTGKAATIKFEMTLAEIEAKGLTAADVCLYHFNKETGLWEKLPTTFKVVDGKVYFEAVTTGFSPFAIVFEKGAATPAAGEDEPVTPPTETPDVPGTPGTLPPADEPQDEPENPESPAPVLAVLAGLGAVVALRRK